MGAATTAGSVRHALGAAVDALRAAGVDESRLDAELLLAEAMGTDRTRLAAEPEAGVPAPAAREFAGFVRRRLRREPVAYILGRRGFRHLDLAVDSRALIPRPETELLVEVALEIRPARALDVGTGSGAVALALAAELPECRVTATDVSAVALELARENAERLGLEQRVVFAAGSVPDEGDFDLIVANLPYVAAGELSSLAPEIREWEPHAALAAGPDGLDAFRALIPRMSSPAVALEVGARQAEQVRMLLREAGFGRTETHRDLAGIERVVVGSR